MSFIRMASDRLSNIALTSDWVETIASSFHGAGSTRHGSFRLITHQRTDGDPETHEFRDDQPGETARCANNEEKGLGKRSDSAPCGRQPVNAARAAALPVAIRSP